MARRILATGPKTPKATVLLAHGAGGAMDTPWMEDMCEALSRRDLQVLRFEFSYMAERRTGGKRRPPPRAEHLLDEYRQVVAEIGNPGRLLIGGKSMGGRVASMIADDLYRSGAISGLLCLGYPFHPVGKPENLRTPHLAKIEVPTLICQGTRDAFGSKEDAASYVLSKAIRVKWLEDGDHDFKPRKAVCGLTLADNLDTAATEISMWTTAIAAKP